MGRFGKKFVSSRKKCVRLGKKCVRLGKKCVRLGYDLLVLGDKLMGSRFQVPNYIHVQIQQLNMSVCSLERYFLNLSGQSKRQLEYCTSCTYNSCMIIQVVEENEKSGNYITIYFLMFYIVQRGKLIRWKIFD